MILRPEQKSILSRQLQFFLQGSIGLEALALVGMDGNEIASALPQEVKPERIAAMSLATFALGEQIAGELDRDGLEQVYVKAKHGFIVLIPLDQRSLLTALARENAKPGLIFLEIRRAADEIRPIYAALRNTK